MKITRVLCLALAMAVFFAAMVACGTEEDQTSAKTEAPTFEEEETEAELPYLDAIDYGKKEFVILGSVSDEEGGRHFSEFGGTLSGDHIAQAIYERDGWLEEKYNLVFRIDTTKNWNTLLTEASMSGDLMFHFATPGISNAVLSISNGNVANLDDFPNLNFNNPWWNKNAIEQMSVIGQHPFALGDINLLAYDSIGLIFFNKGMAEAHNINNLYELLNSGNWTYENMMTIVANVTANTNGDDVFGSGDTFGLTGGSYSALCFVYGGNFSFTVKDEDGVPTLREDLSKVYDFFDKLVTDHSNPAIVGYNLEDQNCFAENRLLFCINMLGTSADMRDSGISYGLLPMPKWTAEQDAYYAAPHQSASTTICVSVANKEYEITSAVLEDMAHYSRDYVLDYYIEENLYYRTLDGDMDSYNAVMELLKHLNCDIFFSYRCGITGMLRNCLDNFNSGLAGQFAKYGSAYTSQLNKIVAGLMEKDEK